MGEVLGQRPDDTSRDAAAVRAAVEREPLPAVRLPRGGRGREVRGVGEDPVETCETSRQVRPHERDVQMLGSGARSGVAEGIRIQVGGDGPCSASGGLERQAPGTGPEVQESPPAEAPSEREEQKRVLALGVDGRRRCGVLPAVGDGRPGNLGQMGY